MARWPQRLRDDRGSALVTTVLVAVVLTALTSILVTTSLVDLNRATQELQRSASYQAAEAGIEDYLAKLTEDRRYLTKWVHPAESTRRKADGTLVAAGGAWDSSRTWTYPTPKNAWRSLGNGYEYNLQVDPPTAGSVVIKLVATGRKTGSTLWARSIEVTVRAGSLAEYQMFSNSNINYGSTATTNGKIYAGNGSNVDHEGTANAPIYAEGSVSGAATGHAEYYDWNSPGAYPNNIRSVIPTEMLFANFASARSEVTTEAASGGVTLPSGSDFVAWKLEFHDDGSFDAYECTSNGNLQTNAPSCPVTTKQTLSVPSNGAIYTAEAVLVSGTLDGRLTVATNESIYIAGTLQYETSGDDVLGLIARVDVIVPAYAPHNLDWYAAVIAETGARHSAEGVKGTHGLQRFYGSTTTFGSPYMDMFDVREYWYDDTLLYLPPPYWPVLDDAYEVLSFRELTP